MAQEVNSHISRSSLNLKPARRSGPAYSAKRQSKSPCGTRISIHNSHGESSGPGIYVQDDDSPAERHELEDIPAPPVPPQRKQMLGFNDSAPTNEYPLDSSVGEHPNTNIFYGRHNCRSASPPRTETYDSDERNYPESVWSESNTNVPRRNLNTFDVAALIFNKMVGLLMGYNDIAVIKALSHLARSSRKLAMKTFKASENLSSHATGLWVSSWDKSLTLFRSAQESSRLQELY